MDRIAVVTGASGGIGRATAKRFARAGYTVYNLSRHPDPDGAFRHIPTDVSDGEAVAAAFARIDREAGRIDVLVNNAGFGISGAAEFTETPEAERLFEVNFFGGLRCAQAAATRMRRQGGGRIVNVSSVAALFAIPFQAFYSASKSAVNALSLAMDNELRPFGIRVLAVMPGDVRTQFTETRHKSMEGEALYGGAIGRSVAVMERDERRGMTPETVAEAVFRAATQRRPKPLRTVGAQYRFFSFLFKVLPTRLINWLVGKLYIK